MSISVDVAISAGSFRLDARFETGIGTTALLGASGAGKTLTLRAIAGLHTPDRGRINIDNIPIFASDRRIDVKSRDRHVGYVFQDYALFPHLTVAENIAFGVRGASRSERDDAVTRMLDLVSLAPLADRRPAGLSGGERQRVALARALATEPRLLLLDEPFSALDAPTRESLTDELLALQARIGIPAILVTHDVSEAYALSDDLVLLGEGRVLQAGPKASVFAAPASPAGAKLVGVQNILTGVAIEPSLIEVGPLRVPTRSAMATGTPVAIGVRAGDVALSQDDASANATLVQTIDRGARLTARLRLDGADTGDGEIIVAELAPGVALVQGQRWRVAIAPDAAMVWPRA
jgi:molybdate transport system ATP-binding protein